MSTTSSSDADDSIADSPEPQDSISNKHVTRTALPKLSFPKPSVLKFVNFMQEIENLTEQQNGTLCQKKLNSNVFLQHHVFGTTKKKFGAIFGISQKMMNVREMLIHVAKLHMQQDNLDFFSQWSKTLRNMGNLQRVKKFNFSFRTQRHILKDSEETMLFFTLFQKLLKDNQQ